MGRSVGVSWAIAAVVAVGCAGQATTTPAAFTPDPVAAPEALPPVRDVPDPLAGMWDHDPQIPGLKGQLEGHLHIQHPCVYLLGHRNWDRILLSLPRGQTDYEASSDSIAVSGRGRVSNGQRATAMGGYRSVRESIPCVADANFKAWQLHPSADPFFGMYDVDLEEPAPSYYSIGILLLEPPCAYLVSLRNWSLASAGSDYDVSLRVDFLSLASNAIRFDRESKSITSSDRWSANDGEVVVVLPGVARANQHATSCSGKWDVGADIVIPAGEVADEFVEERQYMESLQQIADTLWSTDAQRHPCEQLGVCPRVPLLPDP